MQQNNNLNLGLKNWAEIIADSRRAYDSNIHVLFKIVMLKSNLCDYNDTYIPVSGKITITRRPDNAPEANERTDERNREVMFRNCGTFVECTSEMNNFQTDRAKDLDIVMPMYNLIEYSDNYLKTSGTLWQYCRDERALNDDSNVIDLTGNSSSFKLMIKRKNPADGNTNYVKITVSWKYVWNF